MKLLFTFSRFTWYNARRAEPGSNPQPSVVQNQQKEQSEPLKGLSHQLSTKYHVTVILHVIT